MNSKLSRCLYCSFHAFSFASSSSDSFPALFLTGFSARDVLVHVLHLVFEWIDFCCPRINFINYCFPSLATCKVNCMVGYLVCCLIAARLTPAFHALKNLWFSFTTLAFTFHHIVSFFHQCFEKILHTCSVPCNTFQVVLQ